jgi:lipopolysaccharide export system protein LptA
MSALLPLVIALRTTLGMALGMALAMAPGLAWADAGASHRPAEPGLRIAIAPFAGEGDGESIAQQLSQRFSRLGVERLLAPGSFVAERSFDPRPDAVRTWAFQAAVDNVVVGRVERPVPRTEARQIEAVVRSGHSGAELFRHAVHVPARAGLGSALDQLAAAIVRDLGGDPLAGAYAEGSDPTPPVSAKPGSMPAGPAPIERVANAEPQAATKGVAAREKKTDSVDARLGLGEFKSDAPIEIKADEAEIVAEGEGRRLVFTGSVWVHQDTLTLRSDFLEAEYVEGESEPRQLVARGTVRVEQGNRSARCDEARYERTSQQITCRGHAELVQGCDIVRGELIVLDLAANKARVEGAASIVISPKQGTDARCTGAASKP